ncbi:MAG TPA: FecR domain-containing protein [Longimicrobiales bacterium]|nr:FecR domain-containing protein [Longimicrobiales bacterium]
MSEDMRQFLNGDDSDEKLISAIERLPAGTADVDVEAALRRVKDRRFEEPARRAWSTHLLRAAAVIAVLLGGSLIWRSTNSDTQHAIASTQTFVTGVGQTDSLSLPDGTQVVLGPTSSLKLAPEYDKKGRSVEFKGLALFNVKHDDAQPFTVKAGDATIRDVGTSFVVHSDAGQPVHVAVTEGIVDMNGTTLRKGDRGVRLSSGQVQVGAIGSEDLAWTEGKLVFDDATLDQLAFELKRWYGVDLKVADAALTKRHITGSFTHDSVEQVLNVISLVLGARVERNGNTAILHQR